MKGKQRLFCLAGLVACLLASGCQGTVEPPPPTAAATPVEAPATSAPAATVAATATAESVVAGMATAAAVIFTAEEAQTFVLASFSAGEIEGYWTPAPAQVATLESDLADYLQAEERRAQAPSRLLDYPGLWQRLEGFQRQYVGIERDGRREIFANFFCDALGVAWQTTLVEVADGGDCYFEVIYAVDTAAFSDLYVHGES